MQQLSAPMKAAIAFAAAVLLFGCLRYVLSPSALALALLLGAAGLGVAVFVGYSLIKAPTRTTAAAVAVVAVTWVVWLMLPIERLAVEVRFWLDRASYENAVAEAKAAKEPSCVASKACMFEPGSAVSLAFPWEGLVDNWIGVVYYPSGKVIDVDQFKDIFGGELLGCEHLRGPYFLCGFT